MGEEKIVWHPYPEETPTKFYTTYLVTILDVHTNNTYVDFCGWVWSNDTGSTFVTNDPMIIAWAELPEPYKPEGGDRYGRRY